MNILFVAGHLPASQGRQAGQKTSYFMCEYLSQRHALHLLALAPASEFAELDRGDLAIFSSSELIPVSNRVRLAGALSAPHLPLAIAARHAGGFQARLRKLVGETRPDAVIFDHTAMFQYSADVVATAVAVGSAHDIFTQAWRRKAERARNPMAKLLLTAEARRIERWEKRACAGLDLVVTHNEKDKQLLAELEPRAHAIAIDPWMSAHVTSAVARRESGAMIFWGAMNRSENTDAARWAANQILPIIRRSISNATLYIAGNHGELMAPEFAGRDEIVITGFVQDVGALMDRMEIALLPLRLGAGIKVKTLECMAAGLPVVTTSVGAEGVGGVHGTDYFVAESAEEIAAHAVNLLRDKPAAANMGASAKQLIAGTRNFADRMQRVEEHLVEAVARRRAGPKQPRELQLT